MLRTVEIPTQYLSLFLHISTLCSGCAELRSVARHCWNLWRHMRNDIGDRRMKRIHKNRAWRHWVWRLPQAHSLSFKSVTRSWSTVIRRIQVPAVLILLITDLVLACSQSSCLLACLDCGVPTNSAVCWLQRFSASFLIPVISNFSCSSRSLFWQFSQCTYNIT